MVASINEILSTRVTSRVVRTQAGVNSFLLRLFGFNPGGFAERDMGHRQFGYDIFNDTRTVAQGRAPGAPSATVRRQPVGRVDGVFPRFREHLFLPSEEIHNFRVIGGPNSVYDERGVQYALRQQRFMAQRLGNNRALLLAGMIRGKMYGHRSGDDTYYDFTSTSSTFTVDWQMPSANQTDVGGIIDKTWSDPSADIPGHLRAMNASLQASVGTNLEMIIISNATWNYMLNNDQVQAQAGTSNTPFTQQVRVVGTDPGTGLPQTVIEARITAIPWLRIIVTDEGIKTGTPGSESFVKFVPDNYMWWGPTPSAEMFEMLLGSEPVTEGYGAQEVVRYGAYAYTEIVSDPAGRKLHTGDNCIPANYVPTSNGYATVVF